MEPIVEVKLLVLVKFKLKDIPFQILYHSVGALSGSNGAGKGVLIKVLLNILPRDNGEIKFWGQDIQKQEQAIKSKIGCVFDDGFFYEQLSIAEMTQIIAPGYSQ